MKSLTFTGAVLAGLVFSGTALAAEDCTDPVADWQPRETLRLQLEQHGWEVQRIKVDDGCYEVRGVDKIRKLEITFERDGDAADYLDRNPDKKTDEPSVVTQSSGE